FTTVLNYGYTTIKNLDTPDTVLLNEKSYKRVVDGLVHNDAHNDIHDLLSSINNVFLEEGSHPEAMANESELMLDNQVSLQEQSKVSLEQYNEQIGSQDNQQAMNFIRKDKQGSSLQIDDSEYEIIDDGESSKVNEQLYEIQTEANTLFSDHQSDDSLPYEKDNKPLRINRLAPLNISRKKKERAQIQYTSLSNSSEADSDKDESTSSDANDITEAQISSKLSQK
ncbi:33201_t:CDS:2, partial [Racocetra persica]